jgi:SAM-dependent methyltransferase
VWAESQRREEGYDSSKWGIPYSEKYWLHFIRLGEVSAPTLEVGCGEHGLWRFNQGVTGLDPIDYSGLGGNFRRGKAEELPFADDSFMDVIFINSLDHCEDPAKALKEAFRVAKGRVILWNYVFPNSLSKLLYVGHPHAFTLDELRGLIPFDLDRMEYVEWFRAEDLFDRYAHGLSERLKLRVMSVVGVDGLLMHWGKPRA